MKRWIACLVMLVACEAGGGSPQALDGGQSVSDAQLSGGDAVAGSEVSKNTQDVSLPSDVHDGGTANPDAKSQGGGDGHSCKTLNLASGTYGDPAADNSLQVDRVAKTVTWTFIDGGKTYKVVYNIAGSHVD